MNIIVCLDESKGMLFNHRRQSKDSKVLQNIATLTSKLWIHPFSEKMFCEVQGELQVEVKIDRDFLDKATEGEYCFVEDQMLATYIDKIEQIIIYRWNRRYPTDFIFDVDLNEWEQIESVDFEGTSHKKITREIYKKRVEK